MKTPADFDSYLADFPKKTADIMEQIRSAIKEAAPEASEKISYGIPTYFLNGNLLHFGAYKNHIGFYPGPAAIEAFGAQLVSFKYSKGTVQFPLDNPPPIDLIKKIVKYRVEQNRRKV